MVHYKMLMCILSVYITYPSLFWIFAVHWLFSHKHSIHDYNGNSCWVKIGNIGRCCKKKMETNQVSSAFSYLVLTSLIISRPGKYSFTYMSTHHPPHTRLDEWFSDLSMSRVPGRALDASGLPFRLSLASHQQINFWIDRSWVHLGAKKQGTVSLPFSPP